MAQAQPQGGITMVGLGPGQAGQLTREAWDWLSGLDEIFLRTRQHPTVAGFPAGLTIHSFDDIYDQSERFEDVYRQIVEQVLVLGQRPQGVTYAVPGHPFVAEATCPEISRRARELGVAVRVIEGLSFLEPTFTALGLDPYPRLELVDAMDLVRLHTPNFPPDAPALVAQIYSRRVAADVKLTLNAVYPDTHPVRLVHAAGTPEERVEDLALYEIDRSPETGLLTSLYVPPLGAATSFEAFQEIVAHLRAPEGCPWDREQTVQTMAQSMVEEAYEALDAAEREDYAGVREELGDVLLTLMMQAQIASEDGEFTMADVVQGVHRKIVYRHPHVFGEEQVGDVDGVLVNWEKLKAAERAAKGVAEEKGLLDGIPLNLPALAQAYEYQKRAARVGFDWPDEQGVLDKVSEEIQEVRAAQTPEEIEAELGDLLFSVVNFSRWRKIDAEKALRGANRRFLNRFHYIERGASKAGKTLPEMTLAEMDALWDQAKREEAKNHD